MVTLGQSVYNTFILIAYNYFVKSVPQTNIIVHPDERLNISQLVPKYGYPLEEYQIQTEDGYLLGLFRIPYGVRKESNATTREKRQPVMITHGFLSSGQDFIQGGPDIGLAYMLADNGYDVWLPNCRGNRYSRKHVKYHPDYPEFWKFSFHEMGYYDLPALIDHITKTTGYDSINVVGHSQGSTSTFIMASERPEYIKRVKLFVAMAPVVYPNVMPNLIAEFTAAFYKEIEFIVYNFDWQEFMPHSQLTMETLLMICRNNTQYMRLCSTVGAVNMGFSLDIDQNMYPLLVSSFPAGASTRQMLHFVQNKISNSFRKYDHGYYMNKRMYGQSQPPKYNLRTTMPTAVLYSDNDWLSSVDDVDRTCSELKNLKYKIMMERGTNHGDYLFGRKTTKKVVELLLKMFSET